MTLGKFLGKKKGLETSSGKGKSIGGEAKDETSSGKRKNRTHPPWV